MLAVVTALYCPAQITTFYIKPIATNIGYDAIQDSNMVVRNSTTNLDKLFLFIGGTGTHTQQYQTISNFAGNLGYDVINLSYPNSVAAASLSGSSDSLVFNTYRQEVCYGTPLSDDVSVDSLNSIYTRTVHLINYLHTTYPSQNWDQYLINPTTLDWSKIAIGGHSQGGGHACYFAKQNDVDLKEINLKELIKGIIMDKKYKKDLSIKHLLYSLIEIYFRKNISIKNTKLIDIHNYFLKKINNTKIFNLDDESLLMELDERVLDG